jgi:hypothetical protein
MAKGYDTPTVPQLNAAVDALRQWAFATIKTKFGTLGYGFLESQAYSYVTNDELLEAVNTVVKALEEN